MVIIISAVIIALVILCIFAGMYICNLAINTETSNKYFTEDLKVFSTKQSKDEREERKEWLNKNSRIRYNKSFDDLILCGYEIKNNLQKSDVWVIAVHGYMGKGLDMVPCIQKFIKMGYNAFIIDQRAHGKSDGQYRGMGYLECKDLKRWINLIVNEYPNSKIILYGVSMGAATVMMATGELLPSNVKICIEDCGYTSIWEEFKSIYKKSFRLPSFPVLNIASITSKIKAGYSFKDASAIEAVEKSKIPTMFIHGEEDKLVPYYMLNKLYNAATCEKEKLSIRNAGHIESCRVNEQEYWKRVENFVKRYI